MLDGQWNEIKSEASRLGWMDEPLESLIEKVRATMELKFFDQGDILRLRVSLLEFELKRLSEKTEQRKAHLARLVSQRTLSAPFEWFVERWKQARLKSKIGRSDDQLKVVESKLTHLREKTAVETTMLEQQIQMHYNQGKHLRKMTGLQAQAKMEAYDVL